MAIEDIRTALRCCVIVFSSASNRRLWDHLGSKGIPHCEHLLAALPASTASPEVDLSDSLKQHCATDGNTLPLLIAQLESQDAGLYKRRGLRRRPKGSSLFDDLPAIQKCEAEKRFEKLCEKWKGDLPSWRRAILAGVARRLTLHPPNSAWGKRMRRVKGGVHCQREYRKRGQHPLKARNQAMAKRREAILAEMKSTGNVVKISLTPAQEARNRLGVTAAQLRGKPRIAPLLEAAGCTPDGFLEALRWSEEADARAFAQKYDSLTEDDRQYLSIDEISVAAGIEPKRLLRLAVDEIVGIALLTAKMQIAVNLPSVLQTTIDNALTDRGVRNRRIFLEIAGALPYKAEK